MARQTPKTSGATRWGRISKLFSIVGAGRSKGLCALDRGDRMERALGLESGKACKRFLKGGFLKLRKKVELSHRVPVWGHVAITKANTVFAPWSRRFLALYNQE